MAVGRPKRGYFIAGAGIVVAIVLFGVMTAALFVYPDVNAPQRSDAIVALGGTLDAVPQEATKLALQGYAHVVVFSEPVARFCPASVGRGVRVECFIPDPSTTQGEGRAIARLAAAQHWHRIIVVMSTPQATRARLRIGRCFPGQVLEVGEEPSGVGGWLHEIAYEWGALVKAIVLQPSC